VVLFEVTFSEEARMHMRMFSTREQRIILDEVEKILTRNPTKETRNLKVLRPNPLAKYELRIGSFRVFFGVELQAREAVVLAVGRKEGNRLRIGGMEVEL
jgi:mRNA-degrading endonuclease RelE of RelBE toxin-antitoxin system